MELSSSSIVGGQIQQPHACRGKGGTDQPLQLTIRGLPADARFIAIEINPRLAEMFRKQHTDVQIFQDSVANAREICNEAGIDQVDCIVSGLPWASFQESMLVEFLDEMMRVLKPGG